MSPEDQNNAIHKTMGWHQLTPNQIFAGVNLGAAFKKGDIIEIGPPDYTNDLNAMHEAESHLDDFDLWMIYEGHLRKNGSEFVNATAAQRAKAFLKTLDLWEE
jgi:hypothetical protein